MKSVKQIKVSELSGEYGNARKIQRILGKKLQKSMKFEKCIKEIRERKMKTGQLMLVKYQGISHLKMGINPEMSMAFAVWLSICRTSHVIGMFINKNK